MELTKLMYGMIGIVIFIFLTFGFMNSIGTSYDMTASEDFETLYNSSELAFGDLNKTISRTDNAFTNASPVIQTISFVTENTILAGQTLVGGVGLISTFFVTLASIFGLPTYVITAIGMILAMVGMIALFRLFSGGVNP